jgi:hypothetical protein
MAQRLSTTAVLKLEALEEAKRKWDRVHGLLEQAATQVGTRGHFLRQCRRASQEVSRVLDGSGFRGLADTVDQMEFVIKRPGSFHARLGTLREVISSVYKGIESAERAVRDADRKPATE